MFRFIGHSSSAGAVTMDPEGTREGESGRRSHTRDPAGPWFLLRLSEEVSVAQEKQHGLPVLEAKTYQAPFFLVMIVIAPMVRPVRPESSAYLTAGMVGRVYIYICRTGSDRLEHLGKASSAGVDRLSTACRGRGAYNWKSDDIGCGKRAGDGRRIGLRASLRNWHTRRRVPQICTQEQHDPARDCGPAEVNVRLEHCRRQIPIGQFIVDGRASTVNLRREIGAPRRIDSQRRLLIADEMHLDYLFIVGGDGSNEHRQQGCGEN